MIFGLSHKQILKYNHNKYDIGLDEHLFILALSEYAEFSNGELSKIFNLVNYDKPQADKIFESLAETIFIHPYFTLGSENSYPIYSTTKIGEGFFFNGNNQLHGYEYQNLTHDRLTVSFKIFTEKASQDIYLFNENVIEEALNYYHEINKLEHSNNLCSFLIIDSGSKELDAEQKMPERSSPCYVLSVDDLITLRTESHIGDNNHDEL